MKCFHCGHPYKLEDEICKNCHTQPTGAELELLHCRAKLELPPVDLMYEAVLETARRIKAGEEEPDPWDVVKTVRNNRSEKGNPNV